MLLVELALLKSILGLLPLQPIKENINTKTKSVANKAFTILFIVLPPSGRLTNYALANIKTLYYIYRN